MSKASEYVASRGLRVLAQRKEAGGPQIYLEECPFCHDKGTKARPKFTLTDDEAGMYFCFACEAKGNLWTLKRHFGDLELRGIGDRAQPVGGLGTRRADLLAKLQRGKDAGKEWKEPPAGYVDGCEQALWSDRGAAALRYLRVGRGLSDETIRRFRLGYAERHGVGLVSIPLMAGGKCVNVKFRSIPPADKAFERLAGCRTLLFNADALEGTQERAVMIVEGEFDVLAAMQYGFGLPIISPFAGAQGGPAEIEAAREMLAQFDDVLIASDMDPVDPEHPDKVPPGEAFAQKVADLLGRYRCRRVRLPLKDFNECLQAGLPQDQVFAAVNAAQEMGGRFVEPLSSVLERLRTNFAPDRVVGIGTGLPVLDKISGGMKRGQLIVVTGDTGSGKTTLAVRIAKHRAEEGDGVLGLFFENGTEDVARKMLQMTARKPYAQFKPEDFDRCFEKLMPLPLYFVDRACDKAWLQANLFDAIEYGVRRYGLLLIVVDHLHYIADPDPSEDERRVLESKIRAFKELAVRLDVILMLIVHPRQLPEDKDGNPRLPELHHLKGASAIKQDADAVWRVARKRTPMRTEGDRALHDATITTLKHRIDEGREASKPLLYDPVALEFVECDEEEAERRDKELKRATRRGKRLEKPGPTGQGGAAEADDPELGQFT